MPPKVISGGDNPYDIHDAKLSSSATAHESSSVTAHEISNNTNKYVCLNDFSSIWINDCCRITCPINFNLFTGFPVDMHGSTMFLLFLLDMVAEL